MANGISVGGEVGNIGAVIDSYLVVGITGKG